MFRWFERAASTGNGSPLVNMAKCYLSGQGVCRSEQAALQCLAGALASEDIFECDREEAKTMLAAMRPRAV
jgi:TPR repeat protein